jgi:hypothetical protein
MSEVSKLPKWVRILLVVVLIAGIAMPAILLYQFRSRLDLSVWLWGMLLIAGIFAVSIPILFWQEKRKKRPLSFPWPVAAANPYFSKGSPPKDISLEGTLTWTPEIFRRTVKNFVRYTPAGRNHGLSIYILSLIGASGVVLGGFFVYKRELGGLGLIAASAILVAFAYSERVKIPEEIRTRVRVRWTLFHNRFMMNPIDVGESTPERGSILLSRKEFKLARARAIVRTPEGFIIWPDDLIAFCLPIEAFDNAQQVESFHEVARSCVANYVYESDARR